MTRLNQKLRQKSHSSISATNPIPILSQKSLILILSPVLPRNRIIKAASNATIRV